MAEPIGIASGLLTLVGFALQCSKSLYQAIESFQSNHRTIRQLKEELDALYEVLHSLHEVIAAGDTGLSSLKLPLLRCGKACKEFEEVIAKCTAHSGGPRTSFRDWAKLMYMGNDIVGFKNMLASYKSTIAIALGDANIRTAAVTLKVLDEYKEIIKNTTSDLEEHLQEIANKLQIPSSEGSAISEEDEAERKRMREELDSTQQCLDICAQVSAHIDQVQPKVITNFPPASDAPQQQFTMLGRNMPARLATTNTLVACREKLTDTTSELQRYLQDISNRLERLSSKRPMQSNEQESEQGSIREEVESIKQCLAICEQASEQAHLGRTNVFEDVSMAEDGHQVIVSTVGDLLSAKRITAGARSTQWFGQMSDDSLQQHSRDHSRAVTEKAEEPQPGLVTEFRNRYGTGRKLSPDSSTGGSAAHQSRGSSK
ncbi:hypothetical protein K469DRAFT_645268 [Zopfia rhizophila CBS 207.26]|uniref:Azaphilone pigments biosynthesis cluster protein L N-terminal domain-containing protein n=1 Tax=Zopfia rhizophila CBS 207.26 TaxID=1314779 RepID=A0A6A6DBF8_9PEZI|nr:hypothetical protein K469DRAFT_645268 [Zopfia rhizophila CBS 207.26]